MANPNPVPRTGRPNRPKPGAKTVREATAEQWREYTESGLFREDLMSLAPIDRLRMMTTLARFIAPTLKSIEAEITSDTERNPIVDRLIELAGDG